MKKILLFFLLVISVHAQSQKTVTPNWVKSVAQDTATALRAEIALKLDITDTTNIRTFSDLKYVDKASTQTITGNKTFSGNKTVFGTTTNDSVAVRGRLNVSGNIIGLTGKFSNLSNNTIPYNNTSTGLADSRISQDANTTYIRGGSTATSLGSELLTNGTFDTDLSGWTAGAGWGWDSGTAKHTTGNTATLEQSFSTSNNVMYQITVTITNRTAGSITLSFNNGQQNYAGITATGTYHILSTLTGSNKIIITPTTDFNGSMDEVSVKLLTASLPSFILKNTDNSNSGVQIRTGNSANNFYFGINAGKNNTTGNHNSAIGYQALYSNTTGNYNSAIGLDALFSNTTGNHNSAIGYQALYSNTIGQFNSAIGLDALFSNTTGNHNSAIGYQALRSNTTGYYNSAIGRDALYSNTTGSYNSAIGYFALRSIVGQGNIGISYQAGRYNADNSEHTTGNYSNYFGYDTKASTNGVSNENVFGYQAVGMGSNTFVFGSNAITDTYLKGKVHINNDLDVAGYGYFADSIVVGNSTVKIYPDSITIGGTRVPKITEITTFDSTSLSNRIDAIPIVSISYPDANTIEIATGESIILDPSTLEISGGNLTVVGGSLIDTAIVNALIEANEDTSGSAIIGTTETLDSLITDYWNDNLGSGSAWDSTYAYQRIVALENNVSALQDTIAYFTNAITSILAALDTCGCGAVITDNTPPAPPTSLVASFLTGQYLRVTWTDPADADLDSIRIYYGLVNDTTQLSYLGRVAKGIQQYDYEAPDGEVYWFGAKAVDDSGNVSWFSNLDSAKTLASSGPTPLVTLDFEEGDLSEWSSTEGSNLSASTTVVHGGTYSMRVGTNSYGIFNFTAETEVWLTFWIYLPSTSSQSSGYHNIAMFNNSNYDRTCFGTNNSTWSEWIVGVSSGSMTDGDFTTNFSTDTWHKVKLYYKTNGSNLSNHQVWIDDTSIWSDTDIFTNSASNFTVGSEHVTITNYFYIDDIKLYDTDPGAQD